MMKRFLKITYCILFLMISSACVLGMPFYKNDGSAQKRVMAELPQLFVDSKLNLSFPEAFEDWLKDHIAWRDELVTIRSRVLKDIQTSSDKQVIIGTDGWLYFQETVPDFTGEGTFTENQLYRLNAVIREIDDALSHEGTPLIVAIAPNKSTVYPGFMPSGYPRRSYPGNTERLQAMKAAHYVNLTELLKDKARQERLLYHKTDTHWNNYGARLCANALLSAISDATKISVSLPDLAKDGAMRRDWTGDLNQMIYPANTPKEDQYYYSDTEPVYTVKGRMRSLEDLNIKTAGGKTGLNLLVLRDSFSNALIPYLSNAFSNVEYKRQMPLPLLDVNNVDAVVLEIVERRLPELLSGAPVMMAQPCGAWENTGGSSAVNAYAVSTSDGIRVWGFASGSVDRITECTVSITTANDIVYYRAFPVWESKYAQAHGVSDANQDSAFSLLLPQLPQNAQIQVRFAGDSVFMTKPAAIEWINN
jgi:lysophospholipase L1-like esterase